MKIKTLIISLSLILILILSGCDAVQLEEASKKIDQAQEKAVTIVEESQEPIDKLQGGLLSLIGVLSGALGYQTRQASKNKKALKETVKGIDNSNSDELKEALSKAQDSDTKEIVQKLRS